MSELNTKFDDFFSSYGLRDEKAKLIELKANLNSASPSYTDELAQIAELEKKIADEQFLTEDLVTKVKDLAASIKRHYEQTPLQRYQALSPISQFVVHGELDILAIHKNELLVASQLQKFKNIIATQEALDAQYDQKIKKIDEEIVKTVQKRLNSPGDSSLMTKENELRAEQQKLREAKPRISNLSNIGQSLVSPKPASYEEMSLIHSIKNIFNFEGQLPSTSADLISKMKIEIEATQSSLDSLNDPTQAALKEQVEKRLEAMRELTSYYETFSANAKETKPLSFPAYLKVKEVRYELPQKYSNAQGAVTGGRVDGISFEMPPEQSFSLPIQATTHFTCENGAQIIVNPKGELFLPSKAHFGIGDDHDPVAFQASVNLFVQQYLEMNGPVSGQNNIKLNYTGLDETTATEMREAFIKALIEQQCVKIKNGESYVDTSSLRALYIASKDLSVNHVFKAFQIDHGLPHSMFDFNPETTPRALNPLISIKDKLIATHKVQKISKLISECITQFQKEIQENPDVSNLRKKSITSWRPFSLSEEEKLKRAICIVASYDDDSDADANQEYAEAKKIISEKLEQQHQGEPHYNVEKDLKTFIKARIEDRKMAEVRRPGLT